MKKIDLFLEIAVFTFTAPSDLPPGTPITVKFIKHGYKKYQAHVIGFDEILLNVSPHYFTEATELTAMDCVEQYFEGVK